MAATVIINALHGAAGATETQVSGGVCRFKQADNSTDDTANPVPKPSGSDNYSYRKMLRAKVTAAPDGDITNLRCFTDGGSWGTGVTLRGHTLPWANYSQATDATQMVQGSGSALVDMSTKTSGSPITINSGTVLSATTGYGTQDMMELQIEVANTASRGTKGPRVITYRFDES